MKKFTGSALILLLTITFASAQLSFKPAQSLDKGFNSGPLLSGDFDGNSFQDLAALDQNDKRVILYYNPGKVADPKMQIFQVQSPGKGSIYNAVASDFNKDGKTDLAMIDYSTVQQYVGQQSLIILTSTDSSFSQRSLLPSFQTTFYNYQIKALDYDGDSNVDLIVSNSLEFHLFKGDGAGGFSESALTGLPKVYNTVNYFVSEVSDLNADGRYDIVFAVSDTIFVNLQNSDHSFATKKYPTPSTSHIALSMGSGDLTGDGLKEILISYQINNSPTGVPNFIAEYVNDGTGSFKSAPVTIFSGAIWIPPIVTTDFDGDGRIDVLTGSLNGSAFYLLKNTGNNQFTDASVQADYDVDDVNCVFVDLNNDGVMEIATLSYFKFISLYTQSAGKYRFDRRLVFGAPAYRGLTADMNKDGYLDILSVSQISGSVALYLNNRNNGFYAPVFFTEDAGLAAVQAADFNGDGFLDLAYSTTYGLQNTFIKVILSDSKGNLTNKKTLTSNGSLTLAAADFNNDGFIDLAAVNAMYYNDGAGNFSSSFFNLSFSPMNMGATDVNRDSRPDLIFNDGSNLYLGLNDGTGHFSTFNSIPSSGYHYGLDIVDMNNDKLLDILSVHTVGSGPDGFSVFFNQGNGTFKQVISQSQGESLFWSLAGGDFDNDGRKDVAVASGGSTSDGASVYLQQADGSFVITLATPINNSAADYVRISDMNNDGRNDIVTFANNGDAVEVVYNDLLITPTQAPKIKLAKLRDTSADFVLTGNSDGKIAIIRKASDPPSKPKNNMFYSSNANYGTGALLGTSNYVILFRDTTAFTVTGLTKTTSYTIDVYAYNVNAANTLTEVLVSQLDSVSFKTKGTQIVTAAPVAEQIIGAPPVLLSASSSSGLPVTFSVTSGGVTLKLDTAHLVSAGPVKIVAMAAADTTYAVASAEIDFCVDPPVPTITVSQNGKTISLTSSSAKDNIWLYGNVPIDSAKNSTLVVANNGVYKVQVDIGGCKSTSTPTDFIVAGLAGEPGNVNFSYPNPFNEVLYVPTDGQTMQIELLDATGKKVLEKSVADQTDEQFNTASLLSGIYFLRITSSRGVHVQKAMKIAK